ncbi:7-deoxyloganetin glucosyltransferase-like [Tripterygium wilfordii]|uniref:7-deoxyloganetin glucosyltransferase-like n=1 Tax=Tripterygium wilfordii TaxID=458696 RepID=UPI0018F86013|nr:7-deoxyloganetin glucosyltransferase-like [Tripterygium wilfordii]
MCLCLENHKAKERNKQTLKRHTNIAVAGMDSKALADKPHAICIPAPFQSHIKAMLNFSKLLHYKGFHITFVNTEFNHKRLLKARGSDSLDGLPDFRFESIPDGLPPSDDNATQDMNVLCESVKRNFLAPFLDLIQKLNSAGPPVTCIVADAFMMFTTTAAQQLGIPIVFLIVVSACASMGQLQYRPLKEKGIVPLKDESYLTNGYLDMVIDWIPGMKDIRLKNLPSFLQITDPNDLLFNFIMEATEKCHDPNALIIHTFNALEHEVLDALSTIFPQVYAIGPFQLLLNQVKDNRLNSIGCNLWIEEPECLEWLDSKEPNSVIYVNFGSMAVMTKEQLIEFGMGLANSNHYFLWIIRPDLVRDDSVIFPPEFEEKARGRGLLGSWCSQEEVLNHKSIGGFLTHCGWNSILESVYEGVPMLCCPFFGDQTMNCRYTCIEWGIGMEIGSDVNRDEVEKLVKELMEGEEGKKLKHNVMEWKKKAEEATSSTGSSWINLDMVVNRVLLSKDQKLPNIN